MLVYSIVDSPAHPLVGPLYRQRGIEEEVFNSTRKAIGRIKQQPPDCLVAEFRYGYSNNYAGVNVSNLDVLLMGMQRYAPDTRVIVLVSKQEVEYVDLIKPIFPLHAVLIYPVTPEQIVEAIDPS